MPRALLFASIVSLVSAASSAARADYDAKGPRTTTTTTLPAGFAGATGGKLVVPAGTDVLPLVVASHGWSASSANQVGWAEHFASYGFVVVAPDFPSPLSPDPAKNRDIIATIVKTIGAAETSAKGRVDATRFALEGHSAGGLATTLAAAGLKPLATVLFDPVDRDDLAKKAYPSVCSPVLSIFANPSSCNNMAGWRAFRADAVGPVLSFRVVGSTHCDGENADRGFACATFCGGGADKARQSLYAKYATAFLLARVNGDSAAALALTDAALKADKGLEDVLVEDAPSCVAADAGPGPGDAVAPDASAADTSVADDGGELDSDVPSDAESPRDGAPADATVNDASSTDSGGCGCATPRSRALPVDLLLGAFLLLTLSRRRARG